MKPNCSKLKMLNFKKYFKIIKKIKQFHKFRNTKKFSVSRTPYQIMQIINQYPKNSFY